MMDGISVPYATLALALTRQLGQDMDRELEHEAIPYHPPPPSPPPPSSYVYPNSLLFPWTTI